MKSDSKPSHEAHAAPQNQRQRNANRMRNAAQDESSSESEEEEVVNRPDAKGRRRHPQQVVEKTTYEKKREEKEQERQAKEAEAEAERLLAVEKEKAEYEKWKTELSVAEEGAGDEDDEAHSIDAFIDTIKRRKVVILEELASDFNLRSQEVIKRLEPLVEQKRITGIFDDRGRFIYISPEEMTAVANYLNQKGRIGKSDDLVTACNKLVSLTPNLEDQLTEEEVTS
eukprot:Platyproteum_vivax@DN1337_c0_g1_i1.p1